jgi:recombination protein RecR
MSGMYEGAIQDLIDALGRLPGIGPKSAQRIAFHILQSDSEVASALVDSIRVVKERVKFCVSVRKCFRRRRMPNLS